MDKRGMKSHFMMIIFALFPFVCGCESTETPMPNTNQMAERDLKDLRSQEQLANEIRNQQNESIGQKTPTAIPKANQEKP